MQVKVVIRHSDYYKEDLCCIYTLLLNCDKILNYFHGLMDIYFEGPSILMRICLRDCLRYTMFLSKTCLCSVQVALTIMKIKTLQNLLHVL